MDITSISAAIGSLKAAGEIAKGIVDLKSSEEISKKVIDLQFQILAAQDSAMDAKAQCIELVQQNFELSRQVSDLREQINARAAMTFRDNVYWRQVEGGAEEGPFCPKCNDGPAKSAARMASRPDQHWWNCPACGVSIKKPGNDPHSPSPALRRSRTRRI